jgi:hypothetical protein
VVQQEGVERQDDEPEDGTNEQQGDDADIESRPGWERWA